MDSATPKQLAERSGLTTGAITGILDRLEQAGYIRREETSKLCKADLGDAGQ
jgi:DNA-binding MarR family transcriptional regulator